MRLQYLLITLLCGLFFCCRSSHISITQNENSNESSKKSIGSLESQFADKELLEQLRNQQGIARPFAWQPWGGRESAKGGSVIGIDQMGRLKIVDFSRTTDGYTVKPAEYEHKLRDPIEVSGNIELKKLLPDTEFPFQSFIVKANRCNVHFILVWESLNRSLEKRTVFLDAINIRMIVETEGTIASNTRENLLFLSLDQALTDDVNQDGKMDLLLMGSNMSTIIRIWTVEEACSIKPLQFKEGNKLLDSLADKGLKIIKSKNGAYDVVETHYEPIMQNGRHLLEVTESTYQWDRSELVYRRIKTNRRIETN